MSDVGDFLFGEEGEPGQVIDANPLAFQRLANPTAAGIETIIGNSGGPRFEGPFAAALRPEEGVLINNIFRSVAQPSELTKSSRDLTGRTISGEFLSPDSNPFLQDTIRAAQRPLLEAFRDIDIPNIQSAFINAGQDITPGGSSAFDRSLAIASRGLASGLSDIATDIAGQNFQQERGRQDAAAAAVPGIERAELDRIVTGLQQQALPRLVEQLGMDRGLEEFRRQADLLLRALGLGVNAAAARPQALQGVPGTEGALMGILQGVGTGVGAAGAAAAIPALSNSRFKEQIQPVDGERILEKVETLPVHRWKYKEAFGDSGEHVGPMAEDFQEAFGVGDGVTISLVDAFGVAISAVKALIEQNQQLNERVEQLEFAFAA